jgi:hypothetical protein
MTPEYPDPSSEVKEIIDRGELVMLFSCHFTVSIDDGPLVFCTHMLLAPKAAANDMDELNEISELFGGAQQLNPGNQTRQAIKLPRIYYSGEKDSKWYVMQVTIYPTAEIAQAAAVRERGSLLERNRRQRKKIFEIDIFNPLLPEVNLFECSNEEICNMDDSIPKTLWNPGVSSQ